MGFIGLHDAVHFFDGNNGIAAGGASQLVRTTNGGANVEYFLKISLATLLLTLLLWACDTSADQFYQVTTSRHIAITTSAIYAITDSTAISGGNISSDGGDAITARGVCWSVNSNPVASLQTKTSDSTGVGNFSSLLTGLTTGTTYYLRAYAMNSVDTAYGKQLGFTTP